MRDATQRRAATFQPDLFPVYTSDSLNLRFPNDALLHRRVLSLRAWLCEGWTVDEVCREFSLSQATLYRLRANWQAHGLSGLFVADRRAPVMPDRGSLRTLIYRLRTESTFALGLRPEVVRMLPTVVDPAERGLRLAEGLRQAIRAADRALAESYSVGRLLESHYLHGAVVSVLSQLVSYSPASVHRLLLQGLDTVLDHLPPLLMQPSVSLWHSALDSSTEVSADLPDANRRIVLTGTQAQSQAARLADAWARAGWNVLWLHYNRSGKAGVQPFLHAMAQQMATVGLLRISSIDMERPLATQLAVVRSRLRLLPLVVVVNTSQPFTDRSEIGDILNVDSASLRVVSVSDHHNQ